MLRPAFLVFLLRWGAGLVRAIRMHGDLDDPSGASEEEARSSSSGMNAMSSPKIFSPQRVSAFGPSFLEVSDADLDALDQEDEDGAHGFGGMEKDHADPQEVGAVDNYVDDHPVYSPEGEGFVDFTQPSSGNPAAGFLEELREQDFQELQSSSESIGRSPSLDSVGSITDSLSLPTSFSEVVEGISSFFGTSSSSLEDHSSEDYALLDEDRSSVNDTTSTFVEEEDDDNRGAKSVRQKCGRFRKEMDWKRTPTPKTDRLYLVQVQGMEGGKNFFWSPRRLHLVLALAPHDQTCCFHPRVVDATWAVLPSFFLIINDVILLLTLILVSWSQVHAVVIHRFHCVVAMNIISKTHDQFVHRELRSQNEMRNGELEARAHCPSS